MITYTKEFLQSVKDDFHHNAHISYIYVLMVDNQPQYVGKTVNPAARYINHLAGRTADTRFLFQNHKVEMRIVDGIHSKDQHDTLFIEAKWIYCLSAKGCLLLNSQRYENYVEKLLGNPDAYPSIVSCGSLTV